MMKQTLLSMLQRDPGDGPLTPDKVLTRSLAHGSETVWPGSQLLFSGPVSFQGVDMGPECGRIDHYGIGPAGLYCISLLTAERSNYLPVDQDAVEAYYLPVNATELQDVTLLFRCNIFDTPLGREVLTQLSRVESSRPLLSKVWDDLITANIAMAGSAVMTHAQGNWGEPPTPAIPPITADVRGLLASRAHPRVQIFRGGWFSDRENWMAKAFGGTIVAIGQALVHYGPYFLAGDVTLSDSELPTGVLEAMRHLWFQPIEPEDNDALFIRFDAGVKASQNAKARALEKLVSQVGRLICWEGVAS